MLLLTFIGFFISENPDMMNEKKEYVLSNAMKKKPEKIYISLGNKESKTRNVYLKKVQENTEKIVDYYKSEGYDVTFEMNQGNHFKDAALRSAKGILAII